MRGDVRAITASRTRGAKSTGAGSITVRAAAAPEGRLRTDGDCRKLHTKRGGLTAAKASADIRKELRFLNRLMHGVLNSVSNE